MASKITPEQVADLQAHVGHPVPVQDDAGKVVCYMIGADVFDDDSSEYNQRLNALIDEGRASPRVSAEEAHKRMRQTMQRITDKYA
jgi:hypothetical protein